jgi:hypothetical protein
MRKKAMEKTIIEVIKETCHKEREENRLENLQLTSLKMNKHFNKKLPKVGKHILNIIGLQQLSRKPNNIYMNICELPRLHKGQRSYQLQDFQGLLQHNGRQGYKQGLNNLLIIALQLQPRSQPRGLLAITTKRERTRTMNIKIMSKRITNSCNHKKERTRTTNIKIMTTKKVASSCNKDRGKRR